MPVSTCFRKRCVILPPAAHVNDATSAGRLGNRRCPIRGQPFCDIPLCITFPLVPKFFGRRCPNGEPARIRWGPKPETNTFGHEPALVARCCSSARLLGFPKWVGTPRCNDAWRCHQCDWPTGAALALKIRPTTAVTASTSKSSSQVSVCGWARAPRKAGGKPKYIKPGRVPLWNWGRASQNPPRGDARGSGLRKGSQSSGDFIDLQGHEQNPRAQRYMWE